MKVFLTAFSLIGIVFSFSAFAAQIESSKSSQVLSSTVPAPSESSARDRGEARAMIGTNLADITKSRGNLSIDVFLKPQAAFALSYSSYSQEEGREKLSGNPKLTVDRTQFGLGGSFYLKPLQNVYNLALSPSFIFETEKDAVKTEKNTGVALRALGSFKPVHHLMVQAGGTLTAMGSETEGDLYAGLGLLF